MLCFCTVLQYNCDSSMSTVIDAMIHTLNNNNNSIRAIPSTMKCQWQLSFVNLVINYLVTVLLADRTVDLPIYLPMS